MDSFPKAGQKIHHSLIFKLTLIVGITLLLSFATGIYFNIRYQKQVLMSHFIENADRFSETIQLGIRYAMMSNSRQDIDGIVENVSQRNDLKTLRIFNKTGEIKYATNHSVIDRKAGMKDEECLVCHHAEPPLTTLSLSERTRVITAPDGDCQLEIISPVYNVPGCASHACHFHSADQKVLGSMAAIFSLQGSKKAISRFQNGNIVLSVFIFLLASAIVFVFAMKFISFPIRKLITYTQLIAKGQYFTGVDIQQKDELGKLAAVINQMGKEIGENQLELNRQRNDYQHLFEQVPCLIAVQDKNYRLTGFNREFAEKFNPEIGDFCYHAYKGRNEKCDVCPVERTFEDGKIHIGKETGKRKDGSVTHWIVKTSPIRDVDGNIVAAMEMSLDITHSRQLEEKLQETEKKYQEIFNNMPNPAFVLDEETLLIRGCNQRIKKIYGYEHNEILETSFLELFKNSDKKALATALKSKSVLNRISHITKSGETIYVDIFISPFEYMAKKVLLVTTSDITQRLETEQQLIQAGKMATLGEMATGVAHELNQPLSVIKTASSFCLKKTKNHQAIEAKTLQTMIEKIDSNVDRADKIITHMRQLARKTDLALVNTQMNDVLKNAFEIFSQQLRIRGIDVVWNIEENLPLVKADPDRMEQVFINLMINARDAIEAGLEENDYTIKNKKITLETWSKGKTVFIEVRDTGAGISSAIAEKIFEPFFTTKEVGKGTGLGLSISYGIVKDCGGSIQVQSTSKEGTSFVLTFPIKENNDAI